MVEKDGRGWRVMRVDALALMRERDQCRRFEYQPCVRPRYSSSLTLYER